MGFDYSKLRGRIKEKFGTQESFANAMGMAETTVSFKLNNKVSWTQQEINLSCKLLSIEDHDVTAYFFREKVQ